MLCRNPWGETEWKGDWSDSSPLWTEQMQQEIERMVKSDDGTFWMSFEDMVANFYSINVCMTRHPKYNPVPWFESRRKFCFQYLEDDDDSVDDDKKLSVPIFVMTVTDPGHFIVAVHQEDTRCHGAKPYIDLGVTVLKEDPTDGTYTLVNGTGISVERQNHSAEFEVSSGKYLLVPTTTGIKLKQQLKQEKVAVGEIAPPKQLLQRDSAGKIEFTDDVVNIFWDLFDRLDHDGDNLLNKDELDHFMVLAGLEPLQDDVFEWLINNFEPPHTNGLSRQGFINAQLFFLENVGSEEEKLIKEFRHLGYNDRLQLSNARGAVLSVHGTVEMTLNSIPFDPKVFEEAVELPIMQLGNVTKYEGGKVVLYRYRGGYGGVSFLVANNHNHPLKFVMDCSGGKNIISHRDSLKHEELIPPGECSIMHHLAPADTKAGSWSWSYTASYMFM